MKLVHAKKARLGQDTVEKHSKDERVGCTHVLCVSGVCVYCVSVCVILAEL
jgi:hypothetical protein